GVAIVEIAAQARERRALFTTAFGNDGLGFGGEDAADRRPARFDDARLLAGDAGERRAEHLHMIEADAGDDRGFGDNDVGRIEPAAEPDFDDGPVDLARREMEKAESARDLEEGQRLFERPAVVVERAPG